MKDNVVRKPPLPDRSLTRMVLKNNANENDS
jgi:hypothetical protein